MQGGKESGRRERGVGRVPGARWCSGVLSRRPALSSRPVSGGNTYVPAHPGEPEAQPEEEGGRARPVSPGFPCAPRPCLCPPGAPGPAALLPPRLLSLPGLRPSAGTQLSLLFPSPSFSSPPPCPPPPSNVRCCVCCSPRLGLSVHPRLEPAALGADPVYRDAHPGPPCPSVSGHLQGAQHHPPQPASWPRAPCVCPDPSTLWLWPQQGPGGPGGRAWDRRRHPQEAHRSTQRPRPWTQNSGFKSHPHQLSLGK